MQPNLLDELTEDEQELVADQLAEYYDWLAGYGGTSPDELLTYPHTASQRKLLLARMDDLNVIVGHISSVRPLLAGKRAVPICPEFPA